MAGRKSRMIKVCNLTKKYPGKVAVSDVNFFISSGETVGLLGVNGAGKSTIMNMIAGYTSMTSGTVEIDGLDIQEYPAAVRGKVGYLPEQPPLYLDMTVYEYLKFACALKKFKGRHREEIDRVCGLTNISEVARKVIKNLSKGYRQRVGLAQALIGSPKVLILDEPASGMDPKQIAGMRRTVTGFAGCHTVILSSHILSEVQSVCDRIIVIDEGEVKGDRFTKNIRGREESAGRIKLGVTGTQDSAKAVFKGIPQMKSAVFAGYGEGGECNFDVVFDENADSLDARTHITRMLAENGLYVVHMSAEVQNVEEIFMKLTDGTQSASEPGSGEEREYL
jgi:ABC-2 type transport system ATP-binding protein